MPTTRSKARENLLSLSVVKNPKRNLNHDDSIQIAKKQKRCPLRRKKPRTSGNAVLLPIRMMIIKLPLLLMMVRNRTILGVKIIKF